MKSAPKWSELKSLLQMLDRPELLAVVKDLYNASAENRAFLAARFPIAGRQLALEPYRRRIVVQFFPERGFGELNLREARQAISEYRQAANDVAGLLELMLTYVENGTRFTCEYGDIDEPFYNSLDSMLAQFARLVRKHPELYASHRKRLLTVAALAQNVGWGYADSVGEVVQGLESELG